MTKLWGAVLLVQVSVTFTAAGVWMGGASDAPGEAAAVTAFFGLCSVIALFFLVLVGGGGVLAIAGAVMAFGGRSLGWPFVACAVVIGATGLLLLVGTAVGRLGTRWLAFEPDGLRIGSRTGDHLIPWDDVAGIEVGEIHSNPLVVVALRRPHPGPGDRDLVELFPMSFGLDAGLLARSIDGYARNPGRRAELDQRRLLRAET